MDNGHVYVPRLLTDDAMAELSGLGRPVRVGREEPPTTGELLEGVAGAAAVVCTLTERVDAAVLDAAGAQLQVVANTAVGYDNVDVDAARARGVVVTNTPGVLDRATADLTMGLVLAAARRIAEGDRFLRRGTPWIWGPRMMVGLDLSAGATLGIVGFGRIGRAVARRAQAFDLRVLATPTRAQLDDDERAATEFVELPELLRRSDVVSLHCPLTPETRHLVGADTLALMQPHALLVNTARGGVVDTDALVTALREGRIGGAALDVFEDEPAVDPRLLELEQVVLTPHLGSAASVTRSEMCRLAVANAAAVLAGRPPLTPVS
ncbi:lactate dehydrogenase-like 2-hydroxyacid dehydrogenase [Geodermatophilus bullaregiensis]|uniref:2-hydroxyacid dehydrogenase n=1 Tax=Geodermatophilus bullaregiensis TaxID=1564160 RepID=UPI00195B96DB|nr:D-glycerate dehydrogenase [Geodermatophilus bullaregiensis]MBM7808916.1 lactate dehydrogenase-like 2-hydroxyacid dehydrogenase [Geodermatophilus bullaregiensis]